MAMRRREFIAGLGGAAAWPLVVARGQQPERMRHIGVLNGVADTPVAQARVAAFLQGLQQLGWTEDRNLRIETRWAAGNADTWLGHGAVARGNSHRADRIRYRPRSDRLRLRR
jgi:hypothetical protein